MHVHCPHCHNPVEVIEDQELRDVICPSCGSSFNLLPDETVTRVAIEHKVLGHFELMERIGIGAFGEVWTAHDTELDRTVAVKLPRKGQLTAVEAESFLREARSAARLSHPGIVSVHEVGKAADQLFIVSEYVRGVTLSDWLTGRRPTAKEAAELVAQLADAVQHAHEHGVIHRDLKPSNVMLDDAGGVRIMDFGLAKREAGEITMTIDGRLLGTPAYMSPEQAKGAAHDADARSDVYSLGVILFELLTGELPFRGNARMLIHQVINDEAPSPRRLNASVPLDVETICLKCLEKEPGKRYEQAKALADDLRRFLRDTPIQARPISAIERCVRWSRHNKGLAGSLAAVALLMVAVAAGFGVAAKKYADEANAKRQLLEVRQSQLDAQKAAVERSKHQVYNTTVKFLAENQKLSNSNRLTLNRLRPMPGDKDLRDIEFALLVAPGPKLCLALSDFVGSVDAVAVNGDSRLIATDGSDGILRVWRTDNLQILCKFPVGAADLSWHPDGRRLASAGQDGIVSIWDVEEAAELRSVKISDGAVRAIAWCPDGKHLAVGEERGVVSLWDSVAGECIAKWTDMGSDIESVAWSSDGSRLASCDRDGFLRAWATSDSTDPRVYAAHPLCRACCVAWQPNGGLLASCGTDRRICLWDTAVRTEQPFAVLEAPETNVNAISWSPDGELLASGSGDGYIRVWNRNTRKIVVSIPCPEVADRSLSWSRDGKTLFAGLNDSDPYVLGWEVRPQLQQAVQNSGQRIVDVVWSDDGQCLAAATDAGEIRVNKLKDNTELRLLSDESLRPGMFCLSGTGQELAYLSSNGQLQVVDTESASRRRTLTQVPQHEAVVAVSWNPAQPQIATVQSDGTVAVWHSQTGKLVWRQTGKVGSVRSVAWHPKGLCFAIAGKRLLHILDATPNASEVLTISARELPDDWLQSMAWSPEGRKLALAGGFIEVKQSERQQTGFVDNLSSIDKRRAAPNLVEIWDLDAPKRTVTLYGHSNSVWSVCWNLTGSRIVSAGADKTIRIWDTTSLNDFHLERELLTLREPERPARWVRFTSNDTILTSLGTDGCRRDWDGTMGYAVERSSRLLAPIEEKVAAGSATSIDLQLAAEIHARAFEWAQAENSLQKLLQTSGGKAPKCIVLPWWVAGVYPPDGNTAFPPETQQDPKDPIPAALAAFGAQSDSKRWIPTCTEPTKNLDFNDIFPYADNSSLYALTRIYSLVAQELLFEVESDDGIHLWGNGHRAYESHQTPSATYETILLPLNAGWNTVLVRAITGVGRHRLRFRPVANGAKLARAFEKAELWRDALGAWDGAILETPNDPTLLLLRGMLQIRMNRLSEARNDFKKAKALETSHLVPPIRMADTDRLLGLRELDVQQVSNAISVTPHDADLHVRRGELNVLMAHWSAAHTDLLRVLELTPDDDGTLSHLAILKRFLGDDAGYEQTSTALRNRCVAPGGIVFVRAYSGVTLDDEELTQLDGYAGLWGDPEFDQWRRLGAGMTKFRMKDFALAIEFLKDGLVLNRGGRQHCYAFDAHCCLFLAMAQQYAGDRESAQASFGLGHRLVSEAAEACGSPNMTFLTRGSLWREWLMAFAAYREASGLIDCGVSRSVLATLLVHSGQLDKATKVVETGLSQGPADSALLRIQAELLARRGKWSEAADAFAKVIELAPADYASQYRLAVLLRYTGELTRYRATCSEMLGQLSAPDEGVAVDYAMRASLLAADTLGDWTPLIERATHAMAISGKFPRTFDQVLKGFAEYRAARFAESVRSLEAVRTAKDCSLATTIQGLLVLAMAHTRLGAVEEGRRCLDRAKQIAVQKFPEWESLAFAGEWPDWLMCQVLLHEADAVLARESPKIR